MRDGLSLKSPFLPEMNPLKHQQEGTESLDDHPVKKPRISEPETSPEIEGTPETKQNGDVQQDNQNNKDLKIRRRKVVLLLSYSGWGYFGMQR